MSLKEQLMEDMKTAMREKNEIMKNTITMTRAAIKQYEVDNRKEADEAVIIEIVAKEVKKRKEAIIEFAKGDRPEMVANTEKEIEILSVYLPEQLTQDEVRKIIEEAIILTGASSPKDMGKVMQEIKPKISGRADGKMVSDIVKELLNK